MIKEEINWLRSSKCKYCGCELEARYGFEKTKCRICGKVNYRNKKLEFENKLRKTIMKGSGKNVKSSSNSRKISK